MVETLLYIYRNDELRQVYIGIGNSPTRIWGAHNPEAETLLKHPETVVFVTAEKFIDRPSAERAESAAICAAAAAGVTVISDNKDEVSLKNLAKVGSSKHMKRAVFQREGLVRYDELVRTAIVVLDPNSIGDLADGGFRPTLHGGRSREDFHYRATRWWGLGNAESRRRKMHTDDDTLPRDVERLIAVQKGIGTILGTWKLANEQWARDVGHSGWIFVTEGSDDDESDEWRGQWFDWCGAHPSNGVTWSEDIRERIRA